jgi:hypothetical protein
MALGSHSGTKPSSFYPAAGRRESGSDKANFRERAGNYLQSYASRQIR